MSKRPLRTCPFCRMTFDPDLSQKPVFCPGCGNIPATNEDLKMVLPTWIPKVRRPWNAAWAETWDQMSDNEKRLSFLVDAAVILLCLALMMGAFL